MRRITALTLSLLLLGLAPNLFAGISLRAGVALPQGDFQDYAGTGWSLSVVADVRPFSLPFLSVPVLINYAGFGDKEVKWTATETDEIFTQQSTISMTGGGLGLKLQPPALPLKPFAEVMARLTSIEQEYRSGQPGQSSVVDSRTKFGVQFTGGIEYRLAPTISAQLGVTYSTFFGAEMLLADRERQLDINSLGLFVGTTFNLSW